MDTAEVEKNKTIHGLLSTRKWQTQELKLKRVGTGDNGVTRKRLIRKCEFPFSEHADAIVKFLSTDECLDYLRFCRKDLNATVGAGEDEKLQWVPLQAWYTEEDAGQGHARRGMLYHILKEHDDDSVGEGPFEATDGCKYKEEYTFFWGVDEPPKVPASRSGVQYSLEIFRRTEEDGETGLYNCTLVKRTTIEQDVLPYESHQEDGETQITAQMLGVSDDSDLEGGKSIDDKLSAFVEANGLKTKDGDGVVVDISKEKNADCTTSITIRNAKEEEVPDKSVTETENAFATTLRIVDQNATQQPTAEEKMFTAGTVKTVTSDKTPGGRYNVTIETATAKQGIAAGVDSQATVFETQKTTSVRNAASALGDAPDPKDGVSYRRSSRMNEMGLYDTEEVQTTAMQNVNAETSSQSTCFETQTTTVIRNAPSALAATDTAGGGKTYRAQSTLRDNGLYDTQETVTEEVPQEDASNSSEHTALSTRTVTSKRSASSQEDAEETNTVGVTVRVTNEMTPGGLWNTSREELTSTPYEEGRVERQKTLSESVTRTTSLNRREGLKKEEDSSVDNGTITAYEAAINEDGSWNVVKTTTTETEVPKASYSVEATARYSKTTETTENTLACFNGEEEVFPSATFKSGSIVRETITKTKGDRRTKQKETTTPKAISAKDGTIAIEETKFEKQTTTTAEAQAAAVREIVKDAVGEGDAAKEVPGRVYRVQSSLRDDGLFDIQSTTTEEVKALEAETSTTSSALSTSTRTVHRNVPDGTDSCIAVPTCTAGTIVRIDKQMTPGGVYNVTFEETTSTHQTGARVEYSGDVAHTITRETDVNRKTGLSEQEKFSASGGTITAYEAAINEDGSWNIVKTETEEKAQPDAEGSYYTTAFSQVTRTTDKFAGKPTNTNPSQERPSIIRTTYAQTPGGKYDVTTETTTSLYCECAKIFCQETTEASTTRTTEVNVVPAAGTDITYGKTFQPSGGKYCSYDFVQNEDGSWNIETTEVQEREGTRSKTIEQNCFGALIIENIVCTIDNNENYDENSFNDYNECFCTVKRSTDITPGGYYRETKETKIPYFYCGARTNKEETVRKSESTTVDYNCQDYDSTAAGPSYCSTDGKIIGYEAIVNEDGTWNVTKKETTENTLYNATVVKEETARTVRTVTTHENVAPPTTTTGVNGDCTCYGYARPPECFEAGKIYRTTTTKTDSGRETVQIEEIKGKNTHSNPLCAFFKSDAFSSEYAEATEYSATAPSLPHINCTELEHYEVTLREDGYYDYRKHTFAEHDVGNAVVARSENGAGTTVDIINKNQTPTTTDISDAVAAPTEDTFVTDNAIKDTQYTMTPGGHYDKRVTTRYPKKQVQDFTFKTNSSRRRQTTLKMKTFSNATLTEVKSDVATYTDGSIRMNEFGLFDGQVQEYVTNESESGGGGTDTPKENWGVRTVQKVTLQTISGGHWRLTETWVVAAGVQSANEETLFEKFPNALDINWRDKGSGYLAVVVESPHYYLYEAMFGTQQFDAGVAPNENDYAWTKKTTNT